MTALRVVRLGASAWVPRGAGDEPTAAVMPIVCEVSGTAARIVPDICRALEVLLPWADYGQNLIPGDTLPASVLAGYPAGSLAVRTQQGQAAPAYGDANPGPEISTVRLDLVQTISPNLKDLPMLYGRRVEVERAVEALTGNVGSEDPA